MKNEVKLRKTGSGEQVLQYLTLKRGYNYCNRQCRRVGISVQAFIGSIIFVYSFTNTAFS